MMRRAAWLLAVLLACNESAPGQDTGDTDDSAGDTGVPVNCGNDVVDEDEQCDGVDLGGVGCADLGAPYMGGTLACAPTCLFDPTACEVDPAAAFVRLNEITSDSVVSGQFANGNADAIEVANVGGAAADLSGWRLSDDPDFPVERTYVFPDATMLGPGEFLVVTGIDDATMMGDYPFGVSDSSVETITLSFPGGWHRRSAAPRWVPGGGVVLSRARRQRPVDVLPADVRSGERRRDDGVRERGRRRGGAVRRGGSGRRGLSGPRSGLRGRPARLHRRLHVRRPAVPDVERAGHQRARDGRGPDRAVERRGMRRSTCPASY